ncbi:lantibiotic dehydratase [Flavihumibacter sp. R14]|nr:lantibiotic dehydratase [Flavihumibacter soli]
MKSYEFFGQLLLRVPRFPKELIDMDLQELVNNPVFQDALYLASNSVYEELKKRSFELDGCDERVRQTLKKYQHRICYRSTPFGGFASVSAVNWGNDERGLNIRNCSFDIQTLDPHEPEINDSLEEYFQVNPALYAYGSTYRLYEGSGKNEQGARLFKITELNVEGIPTDILSEKGWFKKVDLLNRLSMYGLELREVGGFIDELLENQVLLKVRKPALPRLRPLLYRGSSSGIGANLYAHTSNKTCGSLNVDIQAQIREGIKALKHLCVLEHDTNLEEFKRRFISLFDRREVPLLLALDPEAGIDYGSNASWTTNQKTKTYRHSKGLQWTRTHEVLLGKWTLYRGSGLPIIRLTDEDLKLLEPTAIQHRAPSMMALFNIIPGGIHLHSAGGVSGINILGRFTIFDNELQQMAKKIGELEQAANPDVIFAEVIHESDELADKLNTRHDLREMVIPVLTDSGKEEEYRLELNDLYLSASNGTLVLRSARLNKRVIPRLSTAYNHRRETLSIYRFLCDLQNEGVQPCLNFSMSSLYPGLPFYPSVYYNNILLDPAKWQIEGNTFKKMSKLDKQKRSDAFRKLARELQLPELFVYEQHDQRLLVRREFWEDIEMLIETVKNQKHVFLREYHDDKSGLVRDEENRLFAHELVAIMLNGESIYSGLNDRDLVEKVNAVCFLKDWIYLKAYMHPCGMESFLIHYFSPFIKDVSKRIPTIQWFFIRYYDRDDHLRIRIKCSKGKELLLLKELQDFLVRIQALPNLRSLELASYEKELERYAPIGILTAETLFCLSTGLVLKTISDFEEENSPLDAEPASIKWDGDDLSLTNESGFPRLIAGVLHLNAAFEAAGFKPDEVINFCKNSVNHLFKDLNINKDLRIIYDQDYRIMSGAMTRLFSKKFRMKPQDQYFGVLSAKLRNLNQYNKYKVLIDMNHLHLNRLFPHEPNHQEARCYYYLYKQLIRQLKTAQG